MTFLSLILKNIWRSKIRTLLTVLGISIGIATIVIFGLITSGLKDTMGQMMKPGKTDFTVAKAGSADLMLSFLSNEQMKKIKTVPGVEETVPYIVGVTQDEKNPFFIVIGTDPAKLDLAGVKINEGKGFQTDGEIIIGKITAKNKNLKIGDRLSLGKKDHEIVGIYESGVSFQDSGAMATVGETQRIQGISDKVTMVMVQVADGYEVREVAKAIEAEDHEFVSILDIDDLSSVDQGNEMMDGIAWAISLLAIVIGGIGVMNTIIMSVFERTREIGVLRAIGWRRGRIVAMILGESFIVGIFAGIVGTLIGLLMVWLIQQTEIGQSWITVKYTPLIFYRAFIVSIAVVLFGALYPAYKASKLQPTEALRYE